MTTNEFLNEANDLLMRALTRQATRIPNAQSSPLAAMLTKVLAAQRDGCDLGTAAGLYMQASNAVDEAFQREDEMARAVDAARLAFQWGGEGWLSEELDYLRMLEGMR